MLDSALSNPFQSFDGEDLYPSIQAKAAQLCSGLVKNHPMIDGNKRLGAHAMLVFLVLNGYELFYGQAELSDMVLSLAAGEIGAGDVRKALDDHFVPMYVPCRNIASKGQVYL